MKACSQNLTLSREEHANNTPMVYDHPLAQQSDIEIRLTSKTGELCAYSVISVPRLGQHKQPRPSSSLPGLNEEPANF